MLSNYKCPQISNHRKSHWANLRRSLAPPDSPYEVLLHDEVNLRGQSDGKRSANRVQDAIVHSGINPRLPHAGHRKLEFKRVRHLAADDFPHLIKKYLEIKDDQILELRVMRVDFAVDVGIPLEWFRTNAHLKFKQTSQQFQQLHADQTRKVQTLKFGKSPDSYRVYDKTAQRIDCGEPLLYPGMGKGEPPPTVTRIERECRGKAVPEMVDTLGKLLAAAVDMDPFERLVLHAGTGETDTRGWSAQKWLCSLGLRTAAQQAGGIPALRQQLQERSRGNAKRIFDNYSGLLDAELELQERNCCNSIGSQHFGNSTRFLHWD